jgi:hypothetical protein
MAWRKLSALKRIEKPSLEQLADYPGMTSWFNPKLLLQLLGRVITADVFGQYADRRLIEAALDTTETNLAKRDDISGTMVPDGEGAVWIDFVADLGDGFDSTYAVAYLLAQPNLQFGDLTLPRGSALIMGGDEVYPTATRDEYNVKTGSPYQFAFPHTAPRRRGRDCWRCPAITTGMTAWSIFSPSFAGRNRRNSAIGGPASAAAILA